ncbi:hypothetical protein, partial [Rhizobium leguminosarum]|uniref:hypothetical protein n=1 Tax=Rhizobium leguminosarum TaxID=384 RepID=UPI001C919FD6
LRIVFPSKHRYPPSYACNYEGMARSLQQTNGFGGVMETPVTIGDHMATIRKLWGASKPKGRRRGVL